MRALFLYRHCNVQWHEMLIMAFNKKAAKEVNERINDILNYWNDSQSQCVYINVARTFHSFALSIVGSVDLIMDDNEEIIINVDEQSYKYTPQNLIKDIHCQKIKEDQKIEIDELIISMRSFIGSHSEEQSAPAYKLAMIFEKNNIDNYIDKKSKILKNNQLCDNEDEQLLGMLLSCCGIPFNYKQSVRLRDQTAIAIKFNFTIGDKDNERKYVYDEIHNFDEIKKTDYWRKAKLINPDFVAIKEFIDKVIDSICAKSAEIHNLYFKLADGLILSILPYAELKQIFKLDPERYVKFINYARQIGYKPKEIRNKNIDFNHHDCGRNHDCEKRNRDIAKFVDIAADIYEIYMQRLELEKRFDYTRLLEEAPNLIVSRRHIKFGRTNSIEKLKYLFIDEYQDFSRLFYNLIQAIRKINPTLLSFCVGDDWQAINGFAGSDLKFFSNFNEYFPSSKELNISHNYRSKQRIVELGNFIMRGAGSPSKAKDKALGSIYLIDSKTFELNKYEEAHCSGDIFLASLLRIIQKHLNDGQSVALLSRTSSVKLSNKSYEGRELLAEIRKYFPDKGEFISYHNEDDSESKSNQTPYRVSTAHSFKGLQDDVVILLDLYRFPLVHPDYEYQKILGQTELDIISEEERLLYVAVTRPKSILYLMEFYPDGISKRKRRDTWVRIDNFKYNNLVSEIHVSSYPPIVFPEDKFTLRFITPLGFSDKRFDKQRKKIKDELKLTASYVRGVFQFWYATYHLTDFQDMRTKFENLSELSQQCNNDDNNLDSFVIVVEIDGHIIRYGKTNTQISYFSFDFHLHKIANKDTKSFIAMITYYLENDKNECSDTLLNKTSLGESLLSIVLIYPDAYAKISQFYQLIVDKYNYLIDDFKRVICEKKFLDKAIYLELNELCGFFISIGITIPTNFDRMDLVKLFNNTKDIKKRYELIEKFASWKIDFNCLLSFLIEEPTAEYNIKLFYLHNILYIYQHDLPYIISSAAYQDIKGNYKDHDFIMLVESYLQLDEIETTQIKNDILARNINCLVHFTTFKNLQSILKDKQILSINQLQSSRDNVRANYNYGNFKDHVFCSISVINNILLRNYKNSNFSRDYCILKIRPRYIYTKDTHYSPYYDEAEYSKNNLTIIGSSYRHFSNMFRNSLEKLIDDKPIIINRENISISDNQTTDRQAEVLISKSIHIIDIFEIVVETQDAKKNILESIPNFHKDFPWIDITVDTNSFELPKPAI